AAQIASPGADPDTVAGQRAAAKADWAGLAELEVFAIGIPEEIGGAGGTAADMTVVAEELAAVLAPGPVLPTLRAQLGLARSVNCHLEGSSVPEDTGSFQIMTGAGQDMRALLAALAAGAATAGAGLASDGVTGTVTADGILQVSGTASLVLGAGDATHLL